MAEENTSLVPLLTNQENQALSALQEQFNLLVQRIITLKAELAGQENVQETLRQRVQKEVKPLIRQVVEKRIALIQLFDDQHSQGLLSRKEQQQLASLILEMAAPLLDYEASEELDEIHQRYQTTTPHATPQEPTAPVEQIESQAVAQPEEDWEAAQARLEETLEKERQARQAERNARKNSKLQPKAPDKLHLAGLGTNKTLRKLYMDLAKLLHPDKEPDPAKRPAKEEAMKKVTVAYQQDDFYELLQLQMQFLQEQAAHLNQLPEEQLLPYLQLLQEQVAELEAQKLGHPHHPAQGLYAAFAGTPKQVELKFRKMKRDLREEIQYLELQLLYLQETEPLKQFLKNF